jgi:hypothetical protein
MNSKKLSVATLDGGLRGNPRLGFAALREDFGVRSKDLFTQPALRLGGNTTNMAVEPKLVDVENGKEVLQLLGDSTFMFC